MQSAVTVPWGSRSVRGFDAAGLSLILAQRQQNKLALVVLGYSSSLQYAVIRIHPVAHSVIAGVTGGAPGHAILLAALQWLSLQQAKWRQWLPSHLVRDWEGPNKLCYRRLTVVIATQLDLEASA